MTTTTVTPPTGWPTYLARLVEDIATAPALSTSTRHELLVDALAPLGPVEADRAATDIEQHAYWVRHGAHATGEDAAFAASVQQAAYLTGRALTAGPVDDTADGW